MHHAYVEPCNFLIFLVASSISEIYYCNSQLKKVLYKLLFRYILNLYGPKVQRSSMGSFTRRELKIGDNDS